MLIPDDAERGRQEPSTRGRGHRHGGLSNRFLLSSGECAAELLGVGMAKDNVESGASEMDGLRCCRRVKMPSASAPRRAATGRARRAAFARRHRLLPSIFAAARSSIATHLHAAEGR